MPRKATVRHTGYTDAAVRARKLERECKILDSELAGRPDDAFVLGQCPSESGPVIKRTPQHAASCLVH